MITIEECKPDNKKKMWQMLQLHLHDLSENIALEDDRYGVTDENGMFAFRYFDQYWDDKNFPNSRAFFIKKHDTHIGLIMINSFCISPFEKDAQWNMGEFFLLRKFRGYGFAANAAKIILNQFKGVWTIGVIKENSKVCDFWESVLNKASIQYEAKRNFDKWSAVYRANVSSEIKG